MRIEYIDLCIEMIVESVEIGEITEREKEQVQDRVLGVYLYIKDETWRTSLHRSLRRIG